ncbi:MAG: hypothetical protein EOP49_20810 [Sphingobacteriales bacterium]|nr:MAG: hypothetical protein EOP49_20810 [Sphingobacteriales bacterium]
MRLFSFCLLLLLVSCGGPRVMLPSGGSAPGTNAGPSACFIKGRIITIDRPTGGDSTSPCSRFPCSASVAIMEVGGCGAGVTEPLTPGDIVTMHFSMTLEPSKEVFPTGRMNLPGLESGDVFTAAAVQRLKPGGSAVFVVNEYTRQ